MLNLPGACQLAARRLVEFVFEALDEDGDGKVTLEKARSFYAAHGMDQDTADVVAAALPLAWLGATLLCSLVSQG
jgi:hypothetical protein